MVDPPLQLMETAFLDLYHLLLLDLKTFIKNCVFLITTHMIHKSKNPVFSSLVSSDKSMEQYMKRSRMQSLGVWATEVEIIAAASFVECNHLCICSMW